MNEHEFVVNSHKRTLCDTNTYLRKSNMYAFEKTHTHTHTVHCNIILSLSLLNANVDEEHVLSFSTSYTNKKKKQHLFCSNHFYSLEIQFFMTRDMIEHVQLF